ncbi:MAG: hypothetical protein ACOCV2_02680 [Persicimonas sp.]
MPGWLTWLVALALLVLESAVSAAFGIDTFVIQTPVLITLFLAFRREFATGALVLVALLLPIEWLVVAPGGYYSLGLVVVFLLLYAARGYVDSKWGGTQVLLAVLAVGFHAAIMAGAMWLVEPGSIGGQTFWRGALNGALAAGVVVWPLGVMLDKFDSVATRGSKSAVRLS